MTGKIVTLYLDDASIRLAVVQGKRIKKWAEVPLEPGVIEGGIILKEVEIANRIKRLLNEQKVTGKKVIVGISGLHCLTRPIVLPALPGSMLPEAVMREAKRVLPLPLDQVYISWQRLATSNNKTTVFLVALRRTCADALYRTIHQAGLKPYIIDIKPLALTNLVKEHTAIMVDVQPTDFDIIIMSEGIPQPIRTVAFPKEAVSWQERMTLIIDELERTITFYNTNNPTKPLTRQTPLFISGDLADMPELCLFVSGKLGYSVSSLMPTVKYPEFFKLNRYLANIGLALKVLPSARESGSSITEINALPDVYRPTPTSLFRILALSGGIAAVSLLVPMIIIVQSASANIVSIRGQLDSAQKVIKEQQVLKQALNREIAELEKKIKETEKSTNAFTSALTGLKRAQDQVNGDLMLVTGSLTTAVTLESLDCAKGALTVSGVTASEVDALEYARRLDASGRYSAVIVSKIKNDPDTGTTEFIIILKTKGG